MKKQLIGLMIWMGTAVASQMVMVDPHLSPYSGSADLLTAEQLVIMRKDKALPGKGKNTRAKIWGRVFEQVLFWFPVGSLVSVTQHEYFGHGYRLRDLGYYSIGYKIRPFYGWTSFEVDSSFTVGDALAVTVAGLEAESILARDLKMQWLSKGQIDGRIAPIYFLAQQSLVSYTVSTHLGHLDGDIISAGNDIDAYIELQNASYINNHLTHGQLTRWALFNLLDPMTYYSGFAFFYYIAEGKPWAFPMITLNGGMKYLPNIKVGYAPYAPEGYLENFFLIRGEPLYVYLKGGRRSIGVGFAYGKFFAGRRGTIGFKFDGWNQGIYNTPATVEELEMTGVAYRPSLNQRKWGAALSVTSTLNFNGSIALFTELGGKTSGYLPGYGLDREVVVRIGLRFGANSLRQKVDAQPNINGTLENVVY